MFYVKRKTVCDLAETPSNWHGIRNVAVYRLRDIPNIGYLVILDIVHLQEKLPTSLIIATHAWYAATDDLRLQKKDNLASFVVTPLGADTVAEGTWPAPNFKLSQKLTK